MNEKLCPICNLPTKKYSTIIYKTCGSKFCIVELRKKTNLEKYGHVNFLHGKIGQMKVKQSLIERYGSNITNVSQIPSIREKKIKTCRMNHNVDWPMQSKIVREKSMNSILEKYGVDNISKVPEIIQRIQQKVHSPHPETGLTPFEVGRAKLTIKNIKLYGVPYIFQLDSFKESLKKTMIQRYGVDNIRKSKHFNELMIEKGLRYSEQEAKDLKQYRRQVANHTRNSVKKYFELLLESFDSSSEYHIDHIFSIFDGFKNSIPPEIIGNIINLQLLPPNINIQKGADSWISKEELYSRYNHFDK